jgi:hypothetical protein
MSEEDNKSAYVDWHDRAREIIGDLTRDGYPIGDQLAIVTTCLCMLIARKSDNEEKLAGWAAHAKNCIDVGTRAWFEHKQEIDGSANDQKEA